MKLKLFKRKYKDSVFTDLFGKCKDAKQNFLSLYNALSGSNLVLDDSQIIPVTLKNTVYRSIENDVSMLLNEKLVILVEQQSTINENMHLRFLEYIAAIYQRIIPEQKRYSKRMTEIPASECFVIYNGFENYPEEKTLKLSDMFIKSSLPASSNLEISVKVYNINKCKDTSKLLKCIPLLGYKKLVEYVYNAKKRCSKDIFQWTIFVLLQDFHQKKLLNFLK